MYQASSTTLFLLIAPICFCLRRTFYTFTILTVQIDFTLWCVCRFRVCFWGWGLLACYSLEFGLGSFLNLGCSPQIILLCIGLIQRYLDLGLNILGPCWILGPFGYGIQIVFILGYHMGLGFDLFHLQAELKLVLKEPNSIQAQAVSSQFTTIVYWFICKFIVSP